MKDSIKKIIDGGTPRTDADEFEMFINVHSVSIEDVFRAFQFARKLERELNEMERLAAVRLSYIKLIEAQNDAANERIKRLEEAGNEMHRYITVTRGLLPECTNDWRKVKEVKL